MEIEMIVACGADGSIGLEGSLIWRIPDDLRHFRKLTTGHPVIMGRKTWESLPRRPLPGRLNIVMTRCAGYEAPGAVVAGSAESALEAASEGMPGVTPFIIGGEQIYKAFFPMSTRLHITAVDASCPDADARLPWPLSSSEWRETDSSEIMKAPGGEEYRYLTFDRIK